MRRDYEKSALSIHPAAVTQGDAFRVAGTNWPLDAILLTIDGKERRPDRILSGSLWDGLVVPAEDGSFLVELSAGTLKPGSVAVRAEVRGAKVAAETKVEVRERKTNPEVPRAELDKPAMRGLAFKYERVRDGRWPSGATLAMREDWLRKYGPDIRQLDGGVVFFSAPVPGACNWVPLGPSPFTHGRGAPAANNTGRVRCIAIDPSTLSLMYIGTASGGLWRSTDAGETWMPRTDDKFSLAVGAVTVDPVSPNIVYAGTGEYIPGSDYGAYYGRGLLKSTNLGDTWSEVGIADFDMAEIARIVVNPANNANLFVAASNGLWESTNSGGTWTRLTPDGCTDVVLVQNPAEPGTRRLIAGFASIGVRQSANSGGGWSAFADVTVPGAPANSRRIVFGVCRTQPRTMYAAFCGGAGPGSLAHVARSDDWGQTWTARTIPSSIRIWAAYYNLAIQPHPTNPEILFLGVVDVFKSTDGGGTWASVSLAAGDWVHSDVHSIVWHPTDPNRVYVACDGGVFTTPDLGATWKAINLDVGAIQLYDFGQHPQYEAVMIAGSQDNGGFHYTGAPIWKRHWVAPGVSHNTMGSDGTTAQIDPFNGFVHYYGSGVTSQISRSDDAGTLFNAATWTYFPGTEWWSPFYCHPLSAGVVFTAGHRVWRSDARGNAGTWTDITADLAAPVRSIGFHPTNARVLYAGTTGGHVYRLTGPASGAWTSSTVTTDNVTLTGLPAGIGISSIAVDSSGNVWVTSSDIARSEATGEFSNDHVFRLDAGAMAWVSRSAGLVAANPINAIVIDPAGPGRVFCGGDRGVFEWNAMAGTWTLFDQGLANAPVIKLMVHAPSRKLRAATYGRGLWERSLDGGCTDHFLYLRDNLVDSGRTPSLDHVPHPYIPGALVRHWQSQDIVVDPEAQTPSLVTSAMELYDKVIHLGGRRGANRVYVTAHNKGPFAVTGARVRAFFAPASMGLPPLPAGLLADPFGWNPAGPSVWTPVSLSAFSIPRIEPGTTRLASWNLTIPMSAPRHSCLLAFVTSNEDPFATGGITDPDQLVVNNRKVALRNLDLEAMPGSGSGGGSGTGEGGLPAGTVARELQMYGRGPARAVIYAANLPEDAVFVVAADRQSKKIFRAAEAKPSRRAEKVRELLAKACGKELRDYDFDGADVREAKSGAELDLGEARLQHGRPVSLFVAVHSAKWDREQTYSFDVLQMSGDKVVGGYTVQLADRP